MSDVYQMMEMVTVVVTVEALMEGYGAYDDTTSWYGYLTRNN